MWGLRIEAAGRWFVLFGGPKDKHKSILGVYSGVRRCRETTFLATPARLIGDTMITRRKI